MKLIHNDNFGGDYPNEKFVTGLPPLSSDTLQRIADLVNDDTGPTSPRYYKVVPDDYQLKLGFEP